MPRLSVRTDLGPSGLTAVWDRKSLWARLVPDLRIPWTGPEYLNRCTVWARRNIEWNIERNTNRME
jgi:hypothetical protein